MEKSGQKLENEKSNRNTISQHPSGINQSFDISANKSSQVSEEKSKPSGEIIISSVSTIITFIALLVDLTNLASFDKSMSQVVLVLFIICLTTFLCMIYKSLNCNSDKGIKQKTVNNIYNFNNIYNTEKKTEPKAE